MKGLEILIRGPAGSGKSTLAHEIAHHLATLGFHTIVEDPDPEQNSGVYALRLGSLVKVAKDRGQKLVVRTAQVRRTRSLPEFMEAARQAGDGLQVTTSLLDWGEDGLYDDTRATHLHGLCHSSNDGECTWRECPQRKDGEPEKTGRHCPLDTHEEED
jgi:hypothetical protein